MPFRSLLDHHPRPLLVTTAFGPCMLLNLGPGFELAFSIGDGGIG